MDLSIDNSVIVIRLLLAFAAGAIVGFNRSERGHPAGLRTTILVCLAAAAAMVQVNLLLALHAEKQSLVTLDLMRLPLGILSGMGFIGGGAILRRGDIVHGVTTAATLWFVTVMGLCFGGGQIVLGLELLAFALLTLSALKWFERRFVEQRTGTLVLTTSEDGPTETTVRAALIAASFEVARCASEFDCTARRRAIEFELRWRVHQVRSKDVEPTPPIVAELAATGGVLAVKWSPK